MARETWAELESALGSPSNPVNRGALRPQESQGLTPDPMVSGWASPFQAVLPSLLSLALSVSSQALHIKAFLACLSPCGFVHLMY